jgi:hypothetical protein
MRFFFFLLTFNFSILSFSQNLDFFGIDLNKDFYSLTNASKLSYVRFQEATPKSKYVAFYPSKEISLSEFEQIGMLEVILYFDRDFVGNLNKLLPSLCMVSKYYNSLDDFSKNAFIDYNKILSNLKTKFGNPSKNVVGNKASTSVWVISNKQIVFSMDKEEKKLTLICLPDR